MYQLINNRILQVLALLLLIGGAVYVSTRMFFVEEGAISVFKVNQQNSITDEERSAPITTREVPEGWREYVSYDYGFSLLHPEDLTSTQYIEANGGLTAIFEEESENGKGFQVYAVPYTASTITEEQFLLDQPSGVRNEPVDVFVDNIRGTMFFGHNTLMGDTREVWFIHKGYLYEITTYKEHDLWLAEIMQTWKFI